MLPSHGAWRHPAERTLRALEQLRPLHMWAAGTGAEIVKTIWSPGAIPPEHARVEKLLTRALPTIDVILILFGTFAMVYGVPVFSAVLLGSLSVFFGAGIAMSAAGALAGLAFLNDRLELVSKLVLMSLLAIYPVLLLTVGTVGFDAARMAVGALCLVPLPVLLWRVGDLGWQKGTQT